MGVWIETMMTAEQNAALTVTPCVGVWIETLRKVAISWKVKSHPAWVCGLKLYSSLRLLLVISHTLRGCVD